MKSSFDLASRCHGVQFLFSLPGLQNASKSAPFPPASSENGPCAHFSQGEWNSLTGCSLSSPPHSLFYGEGYRCNIIWRVLCNSIKVPCVGEKKNKGMEAAPRLWVVYSAAVVDIQNLLEMSDSKAKRLYVVKKTPHGTTIKHVPPLQKVLPK